MVRGAEGLILSCWQGRHLGARVIWSLKWAIIHILSFLASCSGGGEARFAFHQFFSELTQCQVFSIQSPLGLTKSSGMLLIICCRNQNGLLPLLMINCFLSSPRPADLPWKTADGGGQVIIAVCSLMMISLCFRIVFRRPSVLHSPALEPLICLNLFSKHTFWDHWIKLVIANLALRAPPGTL